MRNSGSQFKGLRKGVISEMHRGLWTFDKDMARSIIQERIDNINSGISEAIQILVLANQDK